MGLQPWTHCIAHLGLRHGHLEVELVGVLCGSFLLQRLQSLLFGIEILGTKHIVLQ
jgi:hypothetical protein